MAFIVEMMWGRPHQIVVYGPDEYGELVPQEVIPCEGEPDPEYRFYSCHGGVWKHVLDLGVRYGWKPMGTVPARGSQWEREDCAFQNDYQPQMWGYCKQFLAEDAAGLADALERYVSAVKSGEAEMETPKLPTLIKSSMTSMKEFDFANRNLSVEFLKTFISFLRRGPFNFVWDD